MNRNQAAECLTIMQSAWPRWCTDDVSVRLWLRYLERAELDVAREAVDSLVESRRYPPSVADWQETCRGIQVRRQQSRPALEEHRPSAMTEHGRAALEECKRLASTLSYRGSRALPERGAAAADVREAPADRETVGGGREAAAGVEGREGEEA